MPIKAENKHHYRGKAWRDARAAVLARAGNTCECLGGCGDAHEGGRCGAPNGATIVRDSDTPARWREHGGCSLCLGGDAECRPVKVVLTVAHVDHDPAHQDPARLLALCQRCHLRLDATEHAKSAKTTRARKREAAAAEAGQGALALGGGHG